MIQHHKGSWREQDLWQLPSVWCSLRSRCQAWGDVPAASGHPPRSLPLPEWGWHTFLSHFPSPANLPLQEQLPLCLKVGGEGAAAHTEYKLQRLGTTGEFPLRVTWALCAPTNLFHSLPLSLSLPPAPAPSALSHCPPASFREGTGSSKEHFKHRCLGCTQTHCNWTTRERGSDIWAFHYSPGNSNVRGDSQAVPYFAQFSLILQKFLIAFGMWVTMFPIFQCWQGFFSYYYIEINSDLSARQGRLS